jgi:hypothetical protein
VSVRWVAVIVVLGLATVLLVVLRAARYQPPLPPTVSPEAEQTRWVDLYFPSDRGGLMMEPREVRAEPSSNQEALTILRELFRGPLCTGALPLLSEDVRVESFFLDDEGTAYVGLDSTLARDPPGGTSGEVLCVEAILRTVLSNVRGAQSLQLIIAGQVPETLWGHVRLDRPLAASALGTTARSLAGADAS